jgi:hypothetical protein
MATFSELPREIQQKILGHLVNDKTSLTQRDRINLLAPMRVNSFWFQHTTDILWNTMIKLETTFSHLGLQDDRRQLYVSKIRVLNLHTARIYFDLIEDLKFHSLTHLTLRGDHMGILPFLQPNLRTIILANSWYLTRHELDQMTILCPNLRDLQLIPVNISNHRALVVKPNLDPVDCDALLSFFSHARHLRSLTIGNRLPSSLVSAALNSIIPFLAGNLEELVLTNIQLTSLPPSTRTILETCTSLRKFEIRRSSSEDSIPMTMMLEGLAATTSLEHLRLDHDIAEDDVEGLIKRHDAPFGNLKSLELKGGMLPVSRFLSLSMHSLTRLQLVVDDHAHHICPSISHLQSLTHLNLMIGIDRHEWFHAGGRFELVTWQATPEDMQALSVLSKLQSLSIRPTNIILEAPWLSEAYFDTWTAKFPHLQDLNFDIESPLSFSTIVALFENRRHSNRQPSSIIQMQTPLDSRDREPEGLATNVSFELAAAQPESRHESNCRPTSCFCS